MKGKKMMAVLVVLAMMFSTMMVLNKLDIDFLGKASATTPGIDDWGFPTNITNTAPLVYDPDTEVDININTTGLTTDNYYYLYYPVYAGTSTFNLTWRPYMQGSVQAFIKANSPGNDETLDDIILNRSGLWVLNATSENGVIKANNMENFSNTVEKWFWVNTSETLQMSVSQDELYYGQNETITITVTDSEGESADSWMDVRRDNETQPSVWLSYKGEGVFEKTASWMTNFQWAGNYSVIAFTDVDDDTPSYASVSIDAGYNATFGRNPAITADYYSFDVCGPWDPPEYNTSYDRILVNPGVPTTSIPEENETMYWNFDGEVNISVSNYDGTNISALSAYVYNSNDENVTQNLTIDTSNADRGFIKISNNTWGKNGTHIFGTNGTWYAYVFYDVDGDGDASNREWTQEWNTTVEFNVDSAPGVQFKWVDDGSGGLGETGSLLTNGEIPRVPSLAEQPLDIKFKIIGDDHTYYGDEASSDGQAPYEKGENITISGDALFLSSKRLNEYDGVTYSSGTWTVPLTPKMALNGGEITIYVSWSDYGSITETLQVGGDSLNGTVVTISPTEFIIDENLTVTVTVTDAVNAGYGYTNAEVWLYWVGEDNVTLYNSVDGIISYKNGGGSTSGEYTFFVNKSMQTTNQTAAYGSIKAPRNISAYVKLYKGGTTGSTPAGYVYGYALTKMKPISDLKVTAEASGSTSTLMAGKKYSKMWFNTTVVDSIGNTTGYPANSGLKVRIYNESGEDVTASIGSLSTSDTDGKANKTATNEYIQRPGTYTVHAFNNTHNSDGNNATLVIQAVEVTSDVPEFIWNVDKNISAKFTITYNEELLNGTLRIDNMSAVGSTYNKTWTNCSFTPTIGSSSGTDAAGNTSKEITITNGVKTIHNITANFLPGTSSRKNVTLYFKPTGGAWAKTTGLIPVKIPDVSASPASLAYNEPTELELAVSGRGTGLGNVFVSINIPGLSGEMNTTTLSDGTATFAFTPPTTGDITIAIENRTSDLTVPVTSWKLYIDPPSSASENMDFTVTIKNRTAAGAGVANAAVTFNGETKTTDSSGKVTFTAPLITAHREYTITAKKVGHAEATSTVLILNIPKIIIVVQDEVTAGSTFEVIIADDTGNALVGATITINDETFTTGSNGIAKVKAPSEEGTYTISATFPGYTDADPITIEIGPGGIPGFELLTLIAAIGVAFILLRRRRN